MSWWHGTRQVADGGRRVGRPGRWLAVATVAVTVLSACGDDDGEPGAGADGGLAVAEAAVADAEAAVADAQSAVDESSTAFCEDGREYIAAIDRYGDLFAATAPTVGDVTTAGSDLARPREAVAASAESAQEARDELAGAEQDLADAQATLTALQSGSSTTPAEDATTTTAPAVPVATVERVEQAEADLEAASEGISAETPLAEAGAEFNAAAFALEVSWLRLYADAGCLSEDERAEAIAAVSAYTTSLQTALQAIGYYDGPVDGIYGPATAAAVETLQTDKGLPVSGYVDRATTEALEAELAGLTEGAATEAAATIGAVQSTLALAGYWTGPVDGIWTPELTEALTAFQTDLGVPPTGTVDAATLHALQQVVDEATTTTTTSSTTTSTTAADSSSTTTSTTSEP